MSWKWNVRGFLLIFIVLMWLVLIPVSIYVDNVFWVAFGVFSIFLYQIIMGFIEESRDEDNFIGKSAHLVIRFLEPVAGIVAVLFISFLVFEFTQKGSSLFESSDWGYLLLIPTIGAALFIVTRRLFWVLLLFFAGLASLFTMIASIVHFQILMAVLLFIPTYLFFWLWKELAND